MHHAAAVAYTNMCRGCIRYAIIAAIYINRLIDAKDAADRRKERRILIQTEQAERAKQRDELKILQVRTHYIYQQHALTTFTTSTASLQQTQLSCYIS
jgi:hypothetical protein